MPRLLLRCYCRLPCRHVAASATLILFDIDFAATRRVAAMLPYATAAFIFAADDYAATLYYFLRHYDGYFHAADYAFALFDAALIAADTLPLLHYAATPPRAAIHAYCHAAATPLPLMTLFRRFR